MNNKITYTFLCIGAVTLVLALEGSPTTGAYSAIKQEATELNASNEAFTKMMDVLMHQRCMNCHPSDNLPKQGEDRRPHYFGIARGVDNVGFEATNCNTCHQSENNTYSGVPGAPHWSLAPASMGWQGLSLTAIAGLLLDAKSNGGRSHKELVEHMTQDSLVLWAWNPGVDVAGKQRVVPPVTKEVFKEAVTYWFDNGAIIPAK